MDSYGMEVFATEQGRERTAAVELAWLLREAKGVSEPAKEAGRSWRARLALAIVHRRAPTAEAS
jgi:hypothetical protein